MLPRVIITVGASVHSGMEDWIQTLDLSTHIIVGKDFIRKALFGSLQAFNRAQLQKDQLYKVVDQMYYAALEGALLIGFPNIVVYGPNLMIDDLNAATKLFDVFGVTPEIRAFECSRPVLFDRNAKGDPDNRIDERVLSVMHREFMHKDAWWKRSSLPWTRMHPTTV